MTLQGPPCSCTTLPQGQTCSPSSCHPWFTLPRRPCLCQLIHYTPALSNLPSLLTSCFTDTCLFQGTSGLGYPARLSYLGPFFRNGIETSPSPVPHSRSAAGSREGSEERGGRGAVRGARAAAGRGGAPARPPGARGLRAAASAEPERRAQHWTGISGPASLPPQPRRGRAPHLPGGRREQRPGLPLRAGTAGPGASPPPGGAGPGRATALGRGGAAEPPRVCGGKRPRALRSGPRAGLGR